MSSLSPERRVSLLTRKAWTFADTGQVDAAIDTLDEALALVPGPELYCDKVRILARARRYDQALAAAEAGCVDQPGSADLQVARGGVLRRLDRAPEALAAYRQALEVDPASSAGLAGLGNALAEAGDFEEALEAFEALTVLAPRDAETALCRGLVLAKLGRFDEGLAGVDRALELDPSLLEAYLQRARLLRHAGRLEAALEAAEAAIQKTPKYVEGHLLAADVACDLGDLDRAFEGVDKAGALDETDPHVWRIKSVLHARLGRAAASTVCRGVQRLCEGRAAEALVEMDAALDLEPEFVHAWHQKGIVLQALGRSDDAEASLRKAIAIDDRAAKVMLSLGLMLVEQEGRRPEGLSFLQRTVAVDSRLWRALPEDLQKHVNKPAFW